MAIEIHRAIDDFIEERERKKREEVERKAAEEAAQKLLKQKQEDEKNKKKMEQEAAELAKARTILLTKIIDFSLQQLFFLFILAIGS